MADLDLVDIARTPLRLEVLRELGPDDVAAMPSPAAKPPIVAKLRHTHHLLARLLAEGRKAVEVSAITGYSQSRISILQQDPAFRELIEHYKSQVHEAYLNVHGRLAALGVTCVEELQERLEDNPGQFTPAQLREIAEMAFDRSVAPKKGAAAGASGAPGVSISVTFQDSAPKGASVIIDQEGKPDDGA